MSSEPGPIDTALRLAVAAFGGLAVGVEREWSSRAEGRPRFAGVRTFFLLGIIGGLVAELHANGQTAAAAVVLLAACGLTVVAYAATAVAGDVDGTTEVAAVLVLAAGALAGGGQLALASGVFAITALALVEKSRIHTVVYRIQSETLEAAFRFAVLALVVLPLLPEGPYGPEPGFRPRELWTLVLVFSGLSFAGFLALRIAGPKRGYGIAGLLGGLVSSTAVTLNFARESRESSAAGRALGVGVLAACTVLFPRVAVLATVLNPRLALALAPLLWIPLLTGLAVTALAIRRSERERREPVMPTNPLRLAAAVQMAVAFQGVLYAVSWASRLLGSQGVLGSAALLGLVDVDALTYSMVKLGRDAAGTGLAARALAVGILANTVLKLGVALSIGRGRFRLVTGSGLAAIAAGSVVGLLTQ